MSLVGNTTPDAPVITRIAAYIPETKLTIRELLGEIPAGTSLPGFKDKEAYAKYLEETLRLTTVRTETRLSDAEMLVRGLEPVFDDDGIDPAEVDLIIMGQEHDVKQKENLGQFIQMEFGMENAWVFNAAGNHCANIDYAVKLADTLARGDSRIKNILIAGVVKVASAEKRIVGSYGVLGDAAGGMLMRRGGSGLQLVDSKILSAGALHNVDLEKDFSLLLCKYYLKCLNGLLEENADQVGNIKHILIQNANTMLITQCIEMAGLDPELIFSQNLSRYGHLDSMDLVVNMRDLLETETPEANDLVLAFGTGWSGSFNASLFKWKR
jgi:3-oxoacyl-[acyl-carrier-protein] synthase III